MPAEASGISAMSEHATKPSGLLDKYRCRTCGSEKIMVLAWIDGNSNRIFREEEVEYPEVDTVLCRECFSGDTYFLIPEQPFTGPRPNPTSPHQQAGTPAESEE